MPAPVGESIATADVVVIIVNDADTGWGPNAMTETIPVASEANDSKCDGSLADCCGGTTIAPDAAAGFVCIYVAGGTNAVDVEGLSLINTNDGANTPSSPFGFKLRWTSSTATGGQSYIDAVWAYRAPSGGS
jgi:hypothetical protein